MSNKQLTLGSLFSGSGGFELAGIPNLDMTIQGLQCCLMHDPDDKPRCAECPYEGNCLNRLKHDALTLLLMQRQTISAGQLSGKQHSER